MNNKGFAISGILYTLLLIAVVSMNLLLYNLLNRKVILDELKTDTVNAVESGTNFNYLLNEINDLRTLINTKADIETVNAVSDDLESLSDKVNSVGKILPYGEYIVGKTPIEVDISSFDYESILNPLSYLAVFEFGTGKQTVGEVSDSNYITIGRFPSVWTSYVYYNGYRMYYLMSSDYKTLYLWADQDVSIKLRRIYIILGITADEFR